MRSKALLRAFGTALLCASPAIAGGPPWGPGCAPPVYQPPCATPSAPWTPSTPSATPGTPGAQMPNLQPPSAQQAPDVTPQPQTDAFAQAPPTGGEGAQTALPTMIGDLGFYGFSVRSSISTTTTTIPGLTPAQINQRFNLSPTFPSPGTAQYFDLNNSQIFTAAQLTALTQPTVSSQSSGSSVRVPVTSFGAFKISENESVLPTDRVFATYNYYDVDGLHGNSSSINREVVGFEKTFFDGNFSFGVRAPYTEVGDSLGGSSDFDSLSLIFKGVAWRDRDSGNVITGGLVITVPTGPDVIVPDGNSINPTLIQPYIGYFFNFGRAYLHGFTEIVLPTDNSLPTFIANDIGIGYRLQSLPIIPTFEVHTNDAFNHQGLAGSPIGFVDDVILTGGFHTLIGNSDLTLGVATPVSGPRIYSIEAVVQFNWRF